MRQGRRRRLAGGDRGRDRQAAAVRGVGQRHRTRRRRHQRVRRHARRCVRRDRHRLQRPARSATPGSLADREGVEIRTYSVIYKALDELRAAMEGMLAPEEVEETVGRSRSARPSARRRSASSPAPTSRGQGHPRRNVRGSSATAPSSTTARSPRCAASTRTCARSSGLRVRHRARATTRTSRRATSWRSTRRVRSSASSASPIAGLRRAAAGRPALPARARLKAKRKELQSVKAQLRGRLGAAVAEVEHHDVWQRSSVVTSGRCRSAHGAEAAGDRVSVSPTTVFQMMCAFRERGVFTSDGARMSADRMRRVDEAVREVLSDAYQDPQGPARRVRDRDRRQDQPRPSPRQRVRERARLRRGARATIEGLDSAHGFLQRRSARAAAEAHADARVRLRRDGRAGRAHRAHARRHGDPA